MPNPEKLIECKPMKNRGTWCGKIYELDEIKEPRNKSQWNQKAFKSQSGEICHAWESIEMFICSHNEDNDIRFEDETYQRTTGWEDGFK